MTPTRAAVVLGLGLPWTLESIKKAFKRRARETHPDLGGNADAFKEVDAARQVLEEHLIALGGPTVDSGHVGASEGYHSDIDDEPDLAAGTWFDVVGIRCAGKVVEGQFRAQLVQLESKVLNKYGEAIQKRWLFAVYAPFGIVLDSELVEVVLLERGNPEPQVFVRKIVQRSYGMKNKVSAFWFDPLDEPAIEEENIRSNGKWEPAESVGGWYWWDVYTYQYTW